MGRAEQFIKDYTMNCSNIEYTQGVYTPSYHPWLTPDQALRAVEIAKEEIKSEIERLIKSYSPIWSSEGKYRVEAYKEVLGILEVKEIPETTHTECKKINKLCEVKRYDENGKVYSVMLPDTRLFMNKINDVIDAIDNIDSRLLMVEQRIEKEISYGNNKD